MPERGGTNTLFIDVIGNPLTPLSIAGMRRRTGRRSLAVGMAVGAAIAHDDDKAAAPAPADEPATDMDSVQEQLEQLQDMLDNGLITQEDYGREKAEILKQM